MKNDGIMDLTADMLRMSIFDQALFNLEIIGRLQKGKKLDVSKEFADYEKDSMVQGIWRWQNGDGRDRATAFIAKEVATAAEFAGHVLESRYLATDEHPDEQKSRLQTLERVYKIFCALKFGLQNLEDTYTDTNVTASLIPVHVMIDKLVLCIDDTLNSYKFVRSFGI